MARKVRVTPGKLILLQARIGIVVAALFLLFGLIFGVVVGQDLPSSETGLSVLLGTFMLIWVVACLAIVIFYVRLLAARKESPDSSMVDLQFDESSDANGTTSGHDFEVRLRKLEGLKRDGLISEPEYLSKRDQILADKW